MLSEPPDLPGTTKHRHVDSGADGGPPGAVILQLNLFLEPRAGITWLIRHGYLQPCKTHYRTFARWGAVEVVR